MLEIIRARQTSCDDSGDQRPVRSCLPCSLLLLLCLSGGPLQAEYTPIYDVEIVVFRNLAPSDGGERWNTPAMNATAYQRSFPQDQFTELAYRLYRMNGIVRALENSRNYQVLYHRAWRQLAYNKQNSVAYPIETEIESGKRNSVQGWVRLIRERFLHLDIDLFLMANPGHAAGATTARIPLYQLDEKRRIRSGELHYFDHPRFGIIARVTPYQASESPAESPAETPAETPEADSPATRGLPEARTVARAGETP